MSASWPRSPWSGAQVRTDPRHWGQPPQMAWRPNIYYAPDGRARPAIAWLDATKVDFERVAW